MATLDDLMPNISQQSWELIVGVILIIIVIFILWKFLDTGKIPNEKDFNIKF